MPMQDHRLGVLLGGGNRIGVIRQHRHLRVRVGVFVRVLGRVKGMNLQARQAGYDQGKQQ